MRPAHERGAALLTVLLLVAVIAVIAVGVLDDIRFGIRRTANARIGGQAQWYALGAETVAKARIARLVERDPGRTTLAGDWNGRVIEFPIDEGAMRARVRDATDCFNLNSVVEENQGEPFRRRELGVRQLAALAAALGVADGRGLAETLAEWIDSNDVGRPLAEDAGYADLPRPYRTAGGPLAEVSELRAVRGVSPAAYAALRPYVCALPTTDLSPININTLGPERAVLLTALTEGRIDAPLARRAVQARPAQGWASAQAFWGQPALAATPPGEGVRDQLQVATRYFSLDAEVTFAGAQVVLTALFEARSAGVIRLVARRWTFEE